MADIKKRVPNQIEPNIAVKQKRKNNGVRIPFYEELKSASKKSKYRMSVLLEMAWTKFKDSDWYKLAMKEK